MPKHRIKLSKNFYLDEFLRSESAARRGYAQSVDLDGEVVVNLRRLCKQVLQPLRNALGPVHILSGYRDGKVNKWVGGSITSQHCDGLAVDVVVSGHTPLQVCEWLRMHVMFDQLIHEFGAWCHVSIPKLHRGYRMVAYTAIKKPCLLRKPRTVYVRGIISIKSAMEI